MTTNVKRTFPSIPYLSIVCAVCILEIVMDFVFGLNKRTSRCCKITIQLDTMPGSGTWVKDKVRRGGVVCPVHR